MGPLEIELLNEDVEALLLLQRVPARRPGGFLLEGEVHALVAAVLLGMTRLDAFDLDTEAQPPDRELGEIEQAIGAGKGHSVVGANGQRQTTFAEESFEGRDGGIFACGIK